MHTANPWLIPSSEGIKTSKVDEKPASVPHGMRRLMRHCPQCEQEVALLFPESATLWRQSCPNCAQSFALELIGGRRALVIEARGRRVVERIGLTDQRRRFYRVRCHGCETPLVIAEEAVGVRRDCPVCTLAHQLRVERGEVCYFAEPQINGAVMLSCERVVELSGYMYDPAQLLSGVDGAAASRRGVASGGEERLALAEARREMKLLRERDLASRLALRQTTDERAALTRRLEQTGEEREILVAARDAAQEGAEAQRQELLSAREALRRAQHERMMLEEALTATQERLAGLEAERRRLILLLEEETEATEAVESPESMDCHASGNLLSGTGSDETEAQAAQEGWYCPEGQEEAMIPAWDELGLARRVLGISGEPTIERIQWAYRQRVKGYHPDRLASMGLALRNLAHEKMREINRAYGLLMKAHGHG
ncbi:MAG: hypothetical protein HQL86_03710 [Magnetococcales bacterium]|nr:hypothetical protein [Magnetococcales bacterium]